MQADYNARKAISNFGGSPQAVAADLNLGEMDMPTRSFVREPYHFLLLIGATLVLSACATGPGREPIQVSVAGLESLPGEGLEVRTLLKLRVQNPNEAPIDYDGVSVTLDLQGKTYASGVSDGRGTIPRFGEAVIEVPLAISTLQVAFSAIGHMRSGKAPEKLRYKLKGRLGGSLFGPMSFESEGELDLTAPAGQPPQN